LPLTQNQTVISRTMLNAVFRLQSGELSLITRRALKKGTGATTGCICPHTQPLLVVVPVPFFSRLNRRSVNDSSQLQWLRLVVAQR
jgi:hypothetical protein